MSKFVGRQLEVAQIGRCLDRARTGHFSAVLVAGDAGIGKSRLVREAISKISHGANVLAARAYASSGTSPFGLWADAIEGYVANLTDAQASEAFAGLDPVAELLQGAVLSGRRGGGPASHGQLVDAICRFVVRASGSRPVLVVLEDVHEMDPSSWDVLHRLATRREYDQPIGVVLTTRSGRLSGRPEAMRVLLELDQGDVLDRIQLSPLLEDDVRRLVKAEGISDLVATRIYETSGGNPFFVSGLISFLRSAGPGSTYPDDGPIPDEAAEGARAILAEYGPTERMILNVLAVAGSRVYLSDLSTITTLSLDELSPPLAILVKQGLVLEHQVRSRWLVEVVLPIVRDAIVQDLGTAQRLSLHRKVGRVLMASGKLGAAAQHFAASASVGDPEAIDVIIDALVVADQRGAQRESVRLLGVLGDLLPSADPRWSKIAETLGTWVYDHRAEGDDGTAVAALLKIDALPSELLPPARRAAIKARLATVLLYGTGELDHAERAAEETVELIREAGDENKEPLDLAELELAYVRAVAGDLGQWRDRAQAVLDAYPDPAAPAREAANSAIGLVSFMHGDPSVAERAMLQAVDSARARGDRSQLVRHRRSLAWGYAYAGRLSEAIDVFKAARAADPDWRDTNLLEIESNAYWIAGYPRKALDSAREGAFLGLTLRRASGSAFGALSAVELDDPAEARNFVARGKSLFGADGRFFIGSEQFRHAEALLAWHSGDVAGAARILGRASRRLVEIGAPVIALPLLLDLAELSATEVDGPEDLAFAAETARAVADRANSTYARGIAALVGSFADYRAGRPEVSRQLAEGAVDIFEGVDYPALHGRSLARLARTTVGTEKSAELMGRAAQVFDRAELLWRRKGVLAALSTRGVSGRRAAATTVGLDSLTSREREVAGLAQGRLSAQEIANRLSVSRRTVESHLASIYVKLDVHSRVEFMSAMSASKGRGV